MSGNGNDHIAHFPGEGGHFRKIFGQGGIFPEVSTYLTESRVFKP